MKILKIENKYFLIILFILLFSIRSYGQKPLKLSVISGNFQLDSVWRKSVYLSYISTFDQMNTMSKAIIIAETPIDKNGNFTFNIDYLPKKDKLYRLHIAKKNGSIASLIIGGKEENHFFLIANNKSHIIIKNLSKRSVLKPLKISGYKPNQQLNEVNEISNYLDSVSVDNYSIKREFITNAIEEKLRFVADTSSHPLVSLYALNKSNFEANYQVNQQFYKNYLEKWKDEDSSYFNNFKTKLPSTKNNSIIQFIIIGVSAFSIGLFLNQRYFNKEKKSKNSIAELSIQERKIFNSIQKGKSNKEISEEHHIELSTVKSHVSNIYSKLNIKSRREAINIKY